MRADLIPLLILLLSLLDGITVEVYRAPKRTVAEDPEEGGPDAR